MIAVTQISLQKIFLDRRRPAVGDASASSGFGSNVTYVVGSVAPRIGVRPPSGSSPRGGGGPEQPRRAAHGLSVTRPSAAQGRTAARPLPASAPAGAGGA